MTPTIVITGTIVINAQHRLTKAITTLVRTFQHARGVARPWMAVLAIWLVGCCQAAWGQTTILPQGFPDTLPPLVATPAGPPHEMPMPDMFHTIFRMHQTISDAVGDSGELTQLGGFVPHPTDDGIWFFDGQFIILEETNNPRQQTLNFAGNIGVGRRWLSMDDGQVLGLSAWYDFDHGQPAFIHQASIGAELLGEVWDLRANGYFPIGTSRKTLGFSSFGSAFFAGQSVFVPRTRTDLAALTGVDMEVGRRLPGWLGENGVSAYSGFYYYAADRHFNTFGASERLEANLSDTITIDARVTSDPLFKTNLAFGLTYSLPTAGKCKKCACPSDDYYRLIEPVQRNRTIVRGRQSIADNVLAIDANSFQPFRVVHVNSAAPPGGDGTVEHPYQTLPMAQAGSLPNDIVLANANSVFNGQCFAMQAGQRFWGDGINHPINTVEAGTIVLPHASAGSTLPIIQNSPGDAIALASNGNVSGFTVNASGGAAIAGNGISGAVGVDHVAIGGGAIGVSLQNSSATTTFQDLPINGAATGIQLTTNSGATNFNGVTTVSGSTVAGVSNTGGSGPVNFNQLNLTATSGTGLTSTNSTGALTVTGGAITNASGQAIGVTNANVALNLSNVAATSGVSGISLDGASGSVNVAQSTIAGGTTGINLVNNTAAVTLNNTTVNGASTGIAATGAQTNTHFTGTTNVTGATTAGVTDTGGSRNLTFDQLNINATTGTGLSIANSSGLTVANGSITAAGGSALNAANSNGNLNLAAANSTGGPTGINLDTLAGAVTIGGGTIAGGTIGVNLNNNTAAINLTGLNINGAATGVSSSGNQTASHFIGATTVNGSTVNGVLDSTGSGALSFDNLNIGATSGTGLNVQNSTGLIVANGAIANAGGAGLNLSNSTAAINLASVSATNAAGGTGINVSNASGTVAIGGGTITGGAKGINLNNNPANVTISGMAVNNAATGVSIAGNQTNTHFQGTTTISGSTVNGFTEQSATGSVLVDQLAVSAASGTALNVTGSTGLTVTSGTLSNANGGAVNVNNSSVNLNLASVAATGATTGVALTNAAGTVNVAQSTIAGGTTGVALNSNTANIALQNTTVTGAATGISVSGNQNSTRFTGVTTVNGSTVNGATINNATGTIGFDQLDIGATSGTALRINNSSGLTITNGSLANANGAALSATASTASISLANVTATGSGTGVNVTALTGSLNISQATLTGGAVGFNLQNSAAAMTFNNITVNNATTGIQLLGDSGNVVFHGLTNITGSTSTGVFEQAVTSQVAFDDLTINATSGTGLNATGSGLLTISAGSIASASGGAVAITGMPVAISLTSVSSSGGANGLALASTTGSFRVLGASGVAGSGGTLANSSNNGILIQNSTGVSLADINVNGSSSYGANVNASSNVALNGLGVTNATNIGILFQSSGGTNSVINSSVDTPATGEGIYIFQPSTGAIYTISGNQITGSSTFADGLLGISSQNVTYHIEGNNINLGGGSSTGILLEQTGGTAQLLGTVDNTVTAATPFQAIPVGGTFSGQILVNGAPMP